MQHIKQLMKIGEKSLKLDLRKYSDLSTDQWGYRTGYDVTHNVAFDKNGYITYYKDGNSITKAIEFKNEQSEEKKTGYSRSN